MKQGTNNIMKVKIDYDFDLIESIDFIFKQHDNILECVYPSEQVVKVDGENAVFIDWSDHDTYRFSSGYAIKLDTKIHLIGAKTNPETSIVSFIMSPTLFEEEVEDGN